MMEKKIGIYIHIPFCIQKCFYCDFVSFSNKNNLMESYIQAVCQEILQYAEILSSYEIVSIYFGGGTPSYLESHYISKIMDVLELFFSKDSTTLKEITIEINPGTVTKEKLEAYYHMGINRLSIGVQTTHNSILKKLGRQHTVEDFYQTLELAKEAKFDNISCDIIYPLPSLTPDLFEETLQTIFQLAKQYPIKHLSVYRLEVHENTKLEFLLKEEYLSLPDEDMEAQMDKILEEKMKINKFEAYEISNYALSGYESKHNLLYWNQNEYIGFGVNASSFFSGSRYKNVSQIETYIKKIENNESVIEEREDLDKLALMKEYMILKLRLNEGIEKLAFQKKFNITIEQLFKTQVDSLKKKQLLEENMTHIYLTHRGREVANIVWQSFL